MPEVYRVGFEPKDATKTYYQGFAGPGTVFEPGKKIKFTDILDGTSNTIAVIEAGPPVEWTKPVDIPYHPKLPLAKLDGPFSNVILGGMGDGSAHAFRTDFDEKQFRWLIERDDGNVIDLDKLHAKLPLTKEELKSVGEMLAKNEKLLTELAGQFREQQKLLAELAKKGKNPDIAMKGLEFERLARMQRELERILDEIKEETDQLRDQLQEKK
jgi:hypothetical protein